MPSLEATGRLRGRSREDAERDGTSLHRDCIGRYHPCVVAASAGIRVVRIAPNRAAAPRDSERDPTQGLHREMLE